MEANCRVDCDCAVTKTGQSAGLVADEKSADKDDARVREIDARVREIDARVVYSAHDEVEVVLYKRYRCWC